MVADIGKRSPSDAKKKFVDENERLLNILEDKHGECVRDGRGLRYGKRRQIYKKNLEDLDLMESPNVWVSKHRSWSEDVPVVLEYKRRLSHILVALAMLKDIRTTSTSNMCYLSSVSESTERSPSTLQSHATMDNNVSGIVESMGVASGSSEHQFQQFIIAMGISGARCHDPPV
jgi:hypothetical protein